MPMASMDFKLPLPLLRALVQVRHAAQGEVGGVVEGATRMASYAAR